MKAEDPPKSGPRVSVIIPTYNRGYCLGESIRSVIDQSYTDFELIVMDDGSTDNTSQVVSKFPDVLLHRLQKNSGVSAARNLGIRQARGEFICFLDSDDLWKKNKLQVQAGWMEAHPDCCISYTGEVWIRRGVRVNPLNKHRKYSGDIFEQCLPLCIVSPSSVMMRSSLLSRTGGFDETMPVCEDYDLWLRVAAQAPFHFIEEKLIVKRGGHADQLSRKYWGMDRFRVYALLKLLQRPGLEKDRFQLTIRALVDKCGILVKGYSKRGKTEEVEYYRSLIEKYCAESNHG